MSMDLYRVLRYQDANGMIMRTICEAKAKRNISVAVRKKAPLLTNPGPPPRHLRAGWTSEGWQAFRLTVWFSLEEPFVSFRVI
jgi:hypothetical protein